ncbi:Gti1/Pac2 family-domain-containing protein [Mycena vulgaris]|nr:Gti1/Pac2 family-domain-containing protein [Mycena vulgaris]
MPRAEITPCPTHAALHIRDTTDAHLVFEAVRLNILPLVKRRLPPSARAQLQSGNVFVWEESDSEDGLVRWTEGRRWSQSRMRGDFLFYDEKIGTTTEEKQAKSARRAMKAAESSALLPAPLKRKDRPSKLDGLTKHTYSVMVQTPGAAGARKWHIVAYYLPRELPHLPVVEDYSYLRNIRVPAGVFLSNSHPYPYGESLEWLTRPLETGGSSTPSSTQGSLSPVIAPSELDPPLRDVTVPPFPRFPGGHTILLPPISSAHSSTTLPSLSSLGYLAPRPPPFHKYFPTASRTASCHYNSMSNFADDRRVLDKLRVVI